jgi:hypothetical protein
MHRMVASILFAFALAFEADAGESPLSPRRLDRPRPLVMIAGTALLIPLLIAAIRWTKRD